MTTARVAPARIGDREITRAVLRAELGKSVNVREASALLAARGDMLDRLTAVAARVRDVGLVDAGRSG